MQSPRRCARCHGNTFLVPGQESTICWWCPECHVAWLPEVRDVVDRRGRL